MPKGSQFYSADMVQMVAQANRRVAQEAKRQEAGGPEATQAGAVALHYAQRELDAIYGYNSGVEKLSLKGETDPERIKQIIEAAERITGSKMLTVSGRKEAEQKAIASFFGVPRGKITAKQKQIYRALTKDGGGGNVFDKFKESAGGYMTGTIKDAVQLMVENGLTTQQITDTIKAYADKTAAEQQAESIYDYLADKYPEMNWELTATIDPETITFDNK